MGKLKLKLIEIVTAESFINNSHAEEMILKLEKYLTDHIQLINSEKKLEWVYIPDILYIDRDTNQGSAFVTLTEKFVGNIGYETVLNFLDIHDFEVSDRQILVNMANVKKYDSEKGRLYFEDIITDKSVFTYVSQRNTNKFKKHLGKESDISRCGTDSENTNKGLKLPYMYLL